MYLLLMKKIISCHCNSHWTIKRGTYYWPKHLVFEQTVGIRSPEKKRYLVDPKVTIIHLLTLNKETTRDKVNEKTEKSILYTV